jgi:hypothetical protein
VRAPRPQVRANRLQFRALAHKSLNGVARDVLSSFFVSFCGFREHRCAFLEYPGESH